MIAYFRSCLMDSRGYAAVTDARVGVIRGKRQGAHNESGDKRSGIAICPVACHHLSEQSANGVPYPESIINVNNFEAGKRTHHKANIPLWPSSHITNTHLPLERENARISTVEIRAIL